MPQNLYLIGFMGCGKSRVGKLLAHRLRRPFVDLDEQFAKEHDGITAGEFIRTYGEDAFRKEEQLLLSKLSNNQVFIIISTGGGAPAYSGNLELMKNSGKVIFLNAPLEVIEQRLSVTETADRPLWSTQDGTARRKRFDARQPYYRQADCIVDATNTPSAVSTAIQKKLGKWLVDAPRRTTVFRKLLQQVARDSADFGLFAENDRILVGVSGGEDSLMLMHLLTVLQGRLPFPIEIIPATIDLGFPGFRGELLQAYCAKQGWSLKYIKVDGIQELLEKNSPTEAPCALCSRLRRGKLHGLLEELNCNKLALGQHLDDLCASFLIALFRGGGLKTMGPNVAADGGKARLIRPLWGCRKPEIHQVAQLFSFPKIRSCPHEKALRNGDRHFIGELLAHLQERFPDIYSAMRHSMGDLRLAHLLDRRFLGDHDLDAGKL
ncbi:MAG: hypothetical protein J5654_08835 [Victivallales bacterium]|nr:hypothetical protein [Victivallales bacterium]